MIISYLIPNILDKNKQSKHYLYMCPGDGTSQDRITCSESRCDIKHWMLLYAYRFARIGLYSERCWLQPFDIY